MVSITAALEMAQKDTLDLVEISPDSNPPVCKIMDYGKHVFDIKKKAAQQKKKQKQEQEQAKLIKKKTIPVVMEAIPRKICLSDLQ